MVVAAVIALTGCSVPGLWTYESAGVASSAAAAAAFDPVAYVDGIWTSKVQPTIGEKAIDALTLMDAIAKDQPAAVKQYGIPSSSGGAPTFVIKGTGTVSKVDKSVPQGPVTVDLGGGKTLLIITGPVVTGTAIRDAMGITFGQFTNQIDFLNVAQELNNKSKTTVVGPLDLDKLTGQTVSFEGAFALLSPTQFMVVPTRLVVVS